VKNNKINNYSIAFSEYIFDKMLVSLILLCFAFLCLLVRLFTFYAFNQFVTFTSVSSDVRRLPDAAAAARSPLNASQHQCT